jgi:DNA mismatch endonuclease (patch repair protein)
MSDVFSKSQRHVIMSHIRGEDTTPERCLRNALWRKGFRYRLNDKRLPGKPDIVFPKYRTVIFVHGCFWHGHKGCKYYTIPKTNTSFWAAKISRNQERDQEVWRRLEAKGWFVIIVWECQLKKARLQDTADAVADEIQRNGEIYRSLQVDRREARASYFQERRIQREKEAILLREIHP